MLNVINICSIFNVLYSCFFNIVFWLLVPCLNMIQSNIIIPIINRICNRIVIEHTKELCKLILGITRIYIFLCPHVKNISLLYLHIFQEV